MLRYGLAGTHQRPSNTWTTRIIANLRRGNPLVRDRHTDGVSGEIKRAGNGLVGGHRGVVIANQSDANGGASLRAFFKGGWDRR